MSSAKKTESNRANAKKSTGPNTKRGKERAKFNALKSGLYSETRILPCEDAEAHRELAQDVYDDLNPQGPMEEFIVDQIISSMWRIARVDRAELAHLKESVERYAVVRISSSPKPPGAQYVSPSAPPIIRNATAREMFENGFRVHTRLEDVDGALGESMYDPKNVQIYPMIERLRQSIRRAVAEDLAKLTAIQERRITLTIMPNSDLDTRQQRQAKVPLVDHPAPDAESPILDDDLGSNADVSELLGSEH